MNFPYQPKNNAYFGVLIRLKWKLKLEELLNNSRLFKQHIDDSNTYTYPCVLVHQLFMSHNRQKNVSNHYKNHISSMSSHLETFLLEMNPQKYFLGWARPLSGLGAGLAGVWVSPGSFRQLQDPRSETRGAEPQENTWTTQQILDTVQSTALWAQPFRKGETNLDSSSPTEYAPAGVLYKDKEENSKHLTWIVNFWTSSEQTYLNVEPVNLW